VDRTEQRGPGRSSRAAKRLGLLAAWLLALVVAPQALTYARYQSYDSDLYGTSYGGGGGGGGVLLPPLVWVVKDFELTKIACPTLLGICGAAFVGFCLQHCFSRFLNFQRITVFYPPTLKAGEVWRLWTHALLHSDLGHLAMNILHILNTLDLEGVVLGSGYPGVYALGSRHTARAAATATAFGALVGSVSCFGAMFEGASALCFGLDGALLASSALLLGAGSQPSLRGFLEVRGWYAIIHMGIDILRGCSSPHGTIGNVAHVAGFVGGFCYIIIELPELGGRAVPTIPCLQHSGRRWEETHCLAFFTPEYSLSVEQARIYAAGLLLFGAAAAVLNAFVCQRHAHASADGYSVFVKAPDTAFDQAVRRSLQEFRARSSAF